MFAGRWVGLATMPTSGNYGAHLTLARGRTMFDVSHARLSFLTLPTWTAPKSVFEDLSSRKEHLLGIMNNDNINNKMIIIQRIIIIIIFIAVNVGAVKDSRLV